MDAEGDTGKSGDQRVIGINGPLEILFGILAARTHTLQGNLIDIRSVPWCIDLNVSAPGVDQFSNDVPFDLDYVIDEVVEIFVHGFRGFPFEPLGDPVRTEHSHFDGNFGDTLRVTNFLQGQV